MVETEDPNQKNLDGDALANNTFGNEFGWIAVGSLRFFRVVSEVIRGCPGKSPHSRQSRRACVRACVPRGLEVVSDAVASVAFSSVTGGFTARFPLSRYSSLHLPASLPPLSSLSVSMRACVGVHM